MTTFPHTILDHTLAGLGGADLHSHTRHSDGEWTPTTLVEDARQSGITVLSLTDHDTIAGVREAQEAGDRLGIAVISGAEMSLQIGGRLFHILCYDFDPTAPAWAGLDTLRERQRQVFYAALFAQARERGYAIRLEDALEEDGRLVGDPLAAALVKIGAAPTLDAAARLAHSLYLRKPVELLYADAREFGALLPPDFMVCVVAHPARQEYAVSDRLEEDDLRALREALPLVGLEAHHPYHRPDDVTRYLEMAQRFGLVVTCGSDAHGRSVNRPLRAHPPALCADFLALVRERHRSHVGVG